MSGLIGGGGLAGTVSTMVICAVGVFIDISVITVAPIALAIGEKAGLSKSGVLLAMIGGREIADTACSLRQHRIIRQEQILRKFGF